MVDETLDILRQYDGELWMYFVAKVRGEKRLYESLQQQNIPCYLPMLSHVTDYAKRTYVRKLPMFPGYVFAATHSRGFDIESINSVLIKVNFLPEKQSSQLLKDLRVIRKYELLADEFKVDLAPEIKDGTPVLIKKGYFKNEEGFVIKRKNNRVVSINISSIEVALNVELPIDWVAPY